MKALCAFCGLNPRIEGEHRCMGCKAKAQKNKPAAEHPFRQAKPQFSPNDPVRHVDPALAAHALRNEALWASLPMPAKPYKFVDMATGKEYNA